MGVQIGDVVVGSLVLLLGLIGLVLASGALDDGMYVFGWGLAVFAVAFELGLVRKHFDRADAARAQAGAGGHV